MDPALTDPLHYTHQTIETLLTPLYWAAVCPYLTLCAFPASVNAPDVALDASRGSQLNTRGYFRVDAPCTGIPAALVASLERGVHRLVELGHEPSAITMYAEAWAAAAALAPALCRATGTPAGGDTVAFLVAPGRPLFAGPHRDKPLAGAESFRGGAGGAPMFCTAWLALSAAPPEASCLYFLPSSRDCGYLGPGDLVREALPGPLQWPSIAAQPCSAGDCLVFSHRLLHWGGEAREGAQPRVALSFSFADPAFEAAAFDAALLPLPPLPVRLALVAAQAILYAAQAPLSKGQLALNNRIFAGQQRFFSADYAGRVLGEAQSMKFMRRMQGGRA